MILGGESHSNSCSSTSSQFKNVCFTQKFRKHHLVDLKTLWRQLEVLKLRNKSQLRSKNMIKFSREKNFSKFRIIKVVLVEKFGD